MSAPTPTLVRNRTRTWGALVRLTDADYDRDRRRELAYEFGSSPTRQFFENPATSGIYAAASNAEWLLLNGELMLHEDSTPFMSEEL